MFVELGVGAFKIFTNFADEILSVARILFHRNHFHFFEIKKNYFQQNQKIKSFFCEKNFLFRKNFIKNFTRAKLYFILLCNNKILIFLAISAKKAKNIAFFVIFLLLFEEKASKKPKKREKSKERPTNATANPAKFAIV